MVAPRHLLLALGLFLIFAATVTANEDVDASEELLEKMLSGAARAKKWRPKRCNAGCDKPNKAKNKCKAYGGHCEQKRRKCAAGEKFNSKWCKGFCGCCYKEFEPVKCGQTPECRAFNGTLQDTRLPCNGADQINQYSNKDGCTCCVKTVKPLIDYYKDNWSAGSLTGSDGRSYMYTTAPYSWHSCNSWCGENDAVQANVTDVASVAHDIVAIAPGQDFWTSGCDGLSGCTDFRPRYSPAVSCFNYKCAYHQGCLCVQE